MNARSMVGVACATVVCVVGHASKVKADGVILITVDTLRADHVHAYGYPLATTPMMDSVARDGWRFSQAYTPIPLTLPAHVSIMSGLLPMQHGVVDFTSVLSTNGPPLIAELYRKAGYSTAAFVSAPVLDRHFGLSRGFDVYEDHLAAFRYSAFKRPANETVSLALKWLRASSSAKKNFFLWIHLYDPHLPYIAPEPFRTRFREAYDGEIAFADAQIGRLTTFLKAADLYESSTIVITGDHGEALGEHGERTHGFFLYDSTLRVPLIIKKAGPSPPHPIVVETPTETTSICPTLMALNTLKTSVNLDRHALTLQTENAGSPADDENSLYHEIQLPRLHYHWSELRAVRAGRFKYILAPRPELYDLISDPHELHNLVSERSILASKLREQLISVDSGSVKSQRRQTSLSLSDETIARLTALGYVGMSSTQVERESGLADPKDKIVVFNLISESIRLQQNGRSVDALSALREARRLDPACPTIHVFLGRQLLELPALKSQFLEAIDEFREAVRLLPGDLEAMHGLALAYRRAGQFREALLGFETLARTVSADWRVHFDIGLTREALKDEPGAVRAFRAAVARNPRAFQPWMALAYSQMRTADLAGAETAARHASVIDPDAGAPHHLLAAIYASNGQARRSEVEERLGIAKDLGIGTQ